jgi:hypothetical protein
LERKDTYIQFEKPKRIFENIYKCKWIRMFLVIFRQHVTESGKSYYSRTCLCMMAGIEQQFMCTLRSQQTSDCFVVNYCLHNLYTEIHLIIYPLFYPNRTKINERNVLAFPKIEKYIFLILMHIVITIRMYLIIMKRNRCCVIVWVYFVRYFIFLIIRDIILIN